MEYKLNDNVLYVTLNDEEQVKIKINGEEKYLVVTNRDGVLEQVEEKPLETPENEADEFVENGIELVDEYFDCVSNTLEIFEKLTEKSRYKNLYTELKISNFSERTPNEKIKVFNKLSMALKEKNTKSLVLNGPSIKFMANTTLNRNDERELANYFIAKVCRLAIENKFTVVNGFDKENNDDHMFIIENWASYNIYKKVMLDSENDYSLIDDYKEKAMGARLTSATAESNKGAAKVYKGISRMDINE